MHKIKNNSLNKLELMISGFLIKIMLWQWWVMETKMTKITGSSKIPGGPTGVTTASGRYTEEEKNVE